MNWTNKPNYPRPDFLSSSRKRLAPQLMFKGGILHAWGKKMTVALDSYFFDTIPPLKEVKKSDAEVAWLVYYLSPDKENTKYFLKKKKVIYTKFSEALNTITQPKIGEVEDFIKRLQSKVDEKMEAPPINEPIESPF